ncbi:sugar-binding protein [Effusibacillus lacus]|uniref:LacI family transcriptional regulator n=1 Tax=Effusibacillus lacus TaxID=1348429 RepID=A0A292YRY7_9BACL|nr:sugar-binding protein [Effusibacillus lacus]TCS75929.1 monosaccharide ABC transporter substrate-binding protein (CUT2 family) [Effusibacillus lacus]GAX91681.1 LacI family transcriptional regulator [Effusibacillus lacus]
MNHSLKQKIVIALLSGLLFVSLIPTVYYAYKILSLKETAVQNKPQREPDYHFVLIAQDINNPYWKLILQGAEDAARNNNVAIEFLGPVEADMEEHIHLIEKAIASKVDGILTQGLDEAKFQPVIDKAIKRGIPVITVDTDASTSKRLTYIGTNNYMAGYKAGKYMAKATNGKAKIGIITGSFEVSNMIHRIKGFRDAIRDEPGMQIVAVESSNISRVRAVEKTVTLLNGHPEITALFGASALDGMAMAQVVSNRGRNDIYILAFDDLPETTEWMKKGVIAATVVQEPYRMGYDSVGQMINAIRGKQIEPLYYTDTKIFTSTELVGGDLKARGVK